MKMETSTTTMQILELIYMGDWFRKKEIEIALEEKTSRTIANAIFQLKQTGEISEFFLPDYFGSGYELTKKGFETIVNRLDISNEFTKRLPKKLDEEIVEIYRKSPPHHWLHHLLSANALFGLTKYLQGEGEDEVEIIFESKIRRDYPKLGKIPDGAVLVKDGYIWVEAENIKKTGENLLNLSETLVKFNDFRLPRIYGRECIQIVVANKKTNDFSIDDIKDKIYEIAVGNYEFLHLPLDVELGKIKANPPKVLKFKATGTDIFYNLLNRAIFKHDKSKCDSNNNRTIYIAEFRIKYFCFSKKAFVWQVFNQYSDPNVEVARGESDSLESCKKKFCEYLSQFIHWKQIDINYFEFNSN
jgi:hypothetical protein